MCVLGWRGRVLQRRPNTPVPAPRRARSLINAANSPAYTDETIEEFVGELIDVIARGTSSVDIGAAADAREDRAKAA